MKDKDDREQQEESIFKVKTIPPPEGDDDAYNAPTRVGPVSPNDWAELIREADVQGKKTAAADAEHGPESARAKRAAAPKSGPAPAPVDGEVPKIYAQDGDEEVEDLGDATLLHQAAPPPEAVPPRVGSTQPMPPPVPPPVSKPPVPPPATAPVLSVPPAQNASLPPAQVSARRAPLFSPTLIAIVVAALLIFGIGFAMFLTHRH